MLTIPVKVNKPMVLALQMILEGSEGTLLRNREPLLTATGFDSLKCSITSARLKRAKVSLTWVPRDLIIRKDIEY